MITKLTIENFKSIKSLTMDCKRVNVFIGEPNSGKTNILEALGFWSWRARCAYPNTKLGEYVRIQGAQNLFYDNSHDEPIRIGLGGGPGRQVVIAFESDLFSSIVSDGENDQHDRPLPDLIHFNHAGEAKGRPSREGEAEPIRFYRFREMDQFPGTEATSLMPPDGRNLFSLVYGSARFRKTMGEFFKTYGLKLMMAPQEKQFEIVKQEKEELFRYPYRLTSGTLQRVIFYTMAMASNKNATLVFDEPETEAFPYYIKQLGEHIAQDDSNQYFIATHNPYLLNSIAEKGKRGEINVAITRFLNFKTQVKCLTPDQLEELLDADPFFEMSAFFEEDAPA